MNAKEIVKRALDAAGQAGGYDEVAAIAAEGPGAMLFSNADMAVLVDEYGAPGDALYAIQLEAQNRISAMAITMQQAVQAYRDGNNAGNGHETPGGGSIADAVYDYCARGGVLVLSRDTSDDVAVVRMGDRLIAIGGDAQGNDAWAVSIDA